MQAITTTYHGPTRTLNARISARCEAGTLTVEWNPNLGNYGNHDAAAQALLEKLGWHGRDWYSGQTYDGHHVYVLAFHETKL